MRLPRHREPQMAAQVPLWRWELCEAPAPAFHQGTHTPSAWPGINQRELRDFGGGWREAMNHEARSQKPEAARPSQAA
jgi:hypothetical protein